MRFNLIIGVLLVLIAIAGCGQKVVCNKPYILVGTECCLDQNNNAICDKDESANPIKESNTTPQHEQAKEISTYSIKKGSELRVYPIILNNINYSVEFRSMSMNGDKCNFVVTAGDSLNIVDAAETVTDIGGLSPNKEYLLKHLPLKFKLISCDNNTNTANFELTYYNNLSESDYIQVDITNRQDWFGVEEYSCEFGHRVSVQKCEKLGKKANIIISNEGPGGITSGIRFYFYDSAKKQIDKDTKIDWFYTGKSKVFVVDLMKDDIPVKEIHLLPIMRTGNVYTACLNREIILKPDLDCTNYR